MNIGLIPLDERPVNTRYPALLCAETDIDLHLPPAAVLSRFRQPADRAGLLHWLQAIAPRLDALIVSVEMFGYGSLITSRISHESVDVITAQLDHLRDLKQQYPRLMMIGFNLITRISRADEATEEPAYWATYGHALWNYSQLVDRYDQGQPVEAELEALKAHIPADYRADFHARRQRNHAVNRRVLEMTAQGVFDCLVLSSDDTTAYGLATAEKQALAAEVTRLGLDERVLMYPGADEVGCVLLARWVNARHSAPCFRTVYLVSEGAEITAAFEDAPVRLTVERQIKAAGGLQEPQHPDIHLLINPPLSPEAEMPRSYTPAEQAARVPHFAPALEGIRTAAQEGILVAVADVAHSNGADAAFIEALQQGKLLTGLAAYSGWNTAGNSIGTTVAAACLARLYGHNTRFFCHRLLEDYVYQTIVRPAAQSWLAQTTAHPEPRSENLAATQAWIEAAMRSAEPALNLAYRIIPGSVRLPWQRTFEVDFDLEATG